MPTTVRLPASSNPLQRLEQVRPAMAKATLNNLERVEMGIAVNRCFELAGVTQKEAAGLVDRDQAQVARWISGAERAPVDVIFAVPRLRQPMVIALAERIGEGVDVVTEIRIRRSA